MPRYVKISKTELIASLQRKHFPGDVLDALEVIDQAEAKLRAVKEECEEITSTIAQRLLMQAK